MGYATLKPRSPFETLADRVIRSAGFKGVLAKAESDAADGDRAVYLLAKADDGQLCVFVCIVRQGAVKIMDEGMGPALANPGPDFISAVERYIPYPLYNNPQAMLCAAGWRTRAKSTVPIAVEVTA